MASIKKGNCKTQDLPVLVSLHAENYDRTTSIQERREKYKESTLETAKTIVHVCCIIVIWLSVINFFIVIAYMSLSTYFVLEPRSYVFYAKWFLVVANIASMLLCYVVHSAKKGIYWLASASIALALIDWLTVACIQPYRLNSMQLHYQ